MPSWSLCLVPLGCQPSLFVECSLRQGSTKICVFLWYLFHSPQDAWEIVFFYKFYELFSLNSTFINYHQVHSCPWQESRNEVVDDHAVALFLNLDWSHQFRHFRNFDDHQLDRHIRAMLWVPENVNVFLYIFANALLFTNWRGLSGVNNNSN